MQFIICDDLRLTLDWFKNLKINKLFLICFVVVSKSEMSKL
jgi:hypothetical protein